MIVTVAPCSFSKKNGPMMPPYQNPHQSLVMGASASQSWRLDSLSPKCYNFTYWSFVQTIENVLKNCVYRMGNCKASRGSHLDNAVFHSQMRKFNLSNKTILLKKHPQVIFYSQFKFQMLDGPPCIIEQDKKSRNSHRSWTKRIEK